VLPHSSVPRMTRGQRGSLLLHCDGLAPSTSCRSPGAPRLNGWPMLSTLRRRPRERQRTAWGRCGSLLLHRSGLAPPTPCRSPGALRVLPPQPGSPVSVGHVWVGELCATEHRQGGWKRRLRLPPTPDRLLAVEDEIGR